MSIKTLRKRIALVAVSALGAGLMSVVAAPVASAAAAANGEFTLAAANSTTGSAVAGAIGGIENARSLGVVAVTGTKTNTATSNSVTLTAGATTTGTVLPGAVVAVQISSATLAAVSVSGGTLGGHVLTGGANATYNGSATAAVSSANGDKMHLLVTVAPGATSVTISGYTGANVSSTAPSNGVLAGIYSLTVVSSSVAGVYSAADSSVYQQAAKAKGTACDGTTAYDVVASVGNNRVGCVWINPKDAYGNAVTAGSLTVSATNNFKVAIGASPTGAEGYTAATSFASATSAANTYITVAQATANTGGSTVLTIAWQGVVIATKTITFQGDIAKLAFSASSNTTYKNGAVATDAKNGIIWTATDALGQVVDLAAGNVSITDATGSMTPAVLDVSTANSFVTQTQSTGYGSGTMTIAANPLVGAGTYRLAVTNAAGTVIKSDVINATVSGGAASFTAAWDKASYVPGEIATLTITAKDSGGRGLAQGLAYGTGAAITVNTDGLTSLTAACAALDTATVVGADGSRTCKFAVKNTAGSYSYSVAVPTSSSQAAVTGSVKITTSDVSNAEVLASIVKLIAAINKQIRALQKQLRR